MVDFPAIGAEQQFKDYLSEGRFMIQRSRSTGRHVFYPRLLIPGSGETDLEWVEASGLGTVYSVTINRKREGSFNIALIDLDEGVRMISTVEGVVEVPIGSRVRGKVSELNGVDAIVFELVSEVAQ
jgi:uncharacterized OB-fold protein